MENTDNERDIEEFHNFMEFEAAYELLDPESDSDDSDDDFDQGEPVPPQFEAFTEVDELDFTNLQNNHFQPDKEFRLDEASDIIGCKLHHITPAVQTNPLALYLTMWDETFIAVLKSTNKRIIQYNIRHGYTYSDAGFVRLLDLAELIHYYGVFLTMNLHKTPSIPTKHFIQDTFCKKKDSLFSVVGKNMNNVKPMIYNRFNELNKLCK